MADNDDSGDSRLIELREAFDEFDRDGNGTIGPDEFVLLLSNLGAEMSAQECNIGFRELDQDSDGAIAFDEFVAWWTDR